MSSALNFLTITVIVCCTLTSRADVLLKHGKAIAVGKGTRDKGLVHWTYCDGTTKTFKNPPHDFVTGEHCKIQPDAFGIGRNNGEYVVLDEQKFRKFFSNAMKGERVGFTVNPKSVQIVYKHEELTLDLSSETPKHDEETNHR